MKHGLYKSNPHDRGMEWLQSNPSRSAGSDEIEQSRAEPGAASCYFLEIR